VRAGEGLRAVARAFKVNVSTVSLWVTRSQGQRLDRCSFSDGKPGRAWNRTRASQEREILRTRVQLRKGVLGEYGADAIQRALGDAGRYPARATINRVLRRRGALDGVARIRRPAPPRGWYLPAVASSKAELDSFDFIEDLKIAKGPLVQVLTAKSLHGGSTDAWTMPRVSAIATVQCLIERWKREGLPAYAQFDNDTVFQGAHQFADTVGRVSRLCLALGVVPVFVPPLEHGMQNLIEGFNALWQAKVWRRHRVPNLKALQRLSDDYIAAHRARTVERAEGAPHRYPMPRSFALDLTAPLRGTLIFIRRTDDKGRVSMLGQRILVNRAWLHRLVRCEVDFQHHRIRCFALRRRAPDDQPLLATLKYRFPDKPFKGAK
jgi:transposase